MAEPIVPKELLKKLPRTLREEIPTLPEDAQKKFMEKYTERSKKLWLAYLLCILYGTHYAYLNDSTTGIWFWFTVGGLGIWWIACFFILPKQVKDFNSMAAINIMGEVRPPGERPRF